MTTKSYHYQPAKRKNHSTVRVGDKLYMWGGLQPDLPEAHDNEEKRIATSVVEICDLQTGRWEQKPTTGNPPLGVFGYASAVIGNEIFYFGGDCNHFGCYHNSLYSFNVVKLRWTELSPTNSHGGPMMKRDAGMVAAKIDGEDYLVVIGGWGLSSDNFPKQPEADYGGVVPSLQHCNEIHYYKLSSGEWLSPLVSGDRPPPISHFTLTSVTNESAILFGGFITDEWSNKLYIINFSKASVAFSEISNDGESAQWPAERYAHSSVLITNHALGPQLLVVGGIDASDVWLFDIGKRKMKQFFDLPDVVTKRCYHSLSVWSVTQDTHWIIEFGGGIGEMICDTSIIELRYNDADCWSIGAISLVQYQQQLRKITRESLYYHQGMMKEKEWFQKQLISKEKLIQEESRTKEQMMNKLQVLQEEIKRLAKQKEAKNLKEVAVQFDYLVHQSDSIDSSVTIAGKKLLHLQVDTSLSFHWVNFGFRLQCPKGAVSKDTEVAVTALVSGPFIIPKGTMLVSAVYAISISNPLLKALVIDLQHCVDIRNDGQSHCLKFVRAPLESPYQFSIVEGGSFPMGSFYGSIEREEFCAVGIVAEISNGDSPTDSENEEEDSTTPNQGSDNEHDDEDTSASSQEINQDAFDNSGNETEQSSDSFIKGHVQVHHRAIITSGDIVYAGMLYHQWIEPYHWRSMYTVVRNLEVLIQYVATEYPSARRDSFHTFNFDQPQDGVRPSIKLCLDTPPVKERGWTVHPSQEPMELHQSRVDNFESTPIASTIDIFVHAARGIAVKPLHCPIRVTGIDNSTIIYINISPPLPPSSMMDSTNSSFMGAQSSQSRRGNEEGTIVIRPDIASRVISDSTSRIKDSRLDLHFLVDKFVENRIISENERRSITDGHTRQNYDERMDILLCSLSSSITMADVDVFSIFIGILREEGTLRSNALANRLMEMYQNYATRSNNEQ